MAYAVPCILQEGWQELAEAPLHVCCHELLHILADKAASGECKLAVEVRNDQLQDLQAVLQGLWPGVVQLHMRTAAVAADVYSITW
jgi:hypothetical protein